ALALFAVDEAFSRTPADWPIASHQTGFWFHGDQTPLPDDLEVVTAAFRSALESVDLVVTTGGLGPTPDDLTREAIAAAVGEEVAVDAEQETWLRSLFERRGMRFADVNLKQAWLIPSAAALPNPNGTAPGWWVDRPDGRVVILLPGPPREMRPMWHDRAWPRLVERGVGAGRISKVLRLYGIGESLVAEQLGDAMLRAANPIVATYARSDWLDVKLTAVPGADGRPAEEILAEAEEGVRAHLHQYVWAEDETGWPDLVRVAAEAAGVRIATVEAGTGGTLAALLAEVPQVVRFTVHGLGDWDGDVEAAPIEVMAHHAAKETGADVGLALAAHTDKTQTFVRAVVVVPAMDAVRHLDLTLFQHGQHGLYRAAIAATAHLLETFGTRAEAGGKQGGRPSSRRR
ncbi:MAG: molybdopterin-binding protein, partial [Chloroflexota bacterium]